MFGKIRSRLKGSEKSSPPSQINAHSDSKSRAFIPPDVGQTIKVYTILEYVFIPDNFDIKSHLNMREQAGIFKFNAVDLKNLNVISASVRESPIFCLLNNPNINPRVCGYFLHILNELNLVVKTVDNPLRRSHSDDTYDEFCEGWELERNNYIRGQEVKMINFIIINFCKLSINKVVEEYSKTAFNIEKEQYTFDKSLGGLTLEKTT